MSKTQEKVKHLSKVMKSVSTFFLILVPVAVIVMWINFKWAKGLGFFTRLDFPMIEDGPINSYFLGFLVHGAVIALVVAAIYHLRKFFDYGSEGRIFSSESFLSLHKFSKYMILYAFLSIPGDTLLSLIMSINNPEGERYLSVTLQPSDITFIFLGFVFFAISWVFKESLEIAEENAQFV